MKKIFAIISLILTLALIIGGIVITLVLKEDQAPEDTSAALENNTQVWVQFHTWWNTPWGKSRNTKLPYSQWGAWSTFSDYTPAQTFSDNKNKRVISSVTYPSNYKTNTQSKYIKLTTLKYNNLGSYPMIGLYDSADDEIIKYQIKLAKAAGVDAFGVAVYDVYTDNRKTTGKNICADASVPYQIGGIDRFKKILKIASQNNFKVFAEVWIPANVNGKDNECGSRASYRYAISRILNETSNDSAYLKRSNKPVIVLANYGSPSMIVQDLNRIERNTKKDVYWVGNELPLDVTLKSELKTIAVGSILQSGTFIANPDYSSQETKIAQLKQQYTTTILHVYPGFDDSFRLKVPAFQQQQYKPMGLNRVDRSGQYAFEKQLATAKKLKVDIVWIESWNDYQEQTMIEPAFRVDGQDVQNSYKYLEILAAFKGKTFKKPNLPPTNVLDPIK